MNIEKENMIGIVGGMGPQAGLNLLNSILALTEATTDQEHLSVILMSCPKHITDRTAFLERTININPAYSVAKIIQKLEIAGAKIIGMACNTIHAPEIFNVILEELKRSNSGVKLVNMPLATCQYIRKNYPFAKRVGLMTTNGTYKTHLYENILIGLGYDVVIPDFQFQNDIIHRMIYDPQFGIKANPNAVTLEAKLLMRNAIDFFIKNNADAVVLGCTELSLIPIEIDGLIIVDSTEALAISLVTEAKSHMTDSASTESQDSLSNHYTEYNA